ncbi:hypothetical protein MCOR14_002129 [Pyricularia oryzae]|nr:hypothetical protein MCOR14_002129 [Pyricularia oryzae]
MDGVTGGAIAMIILMVLRIIWDFCGMCAHPRRANIQDPSNIEMQDMSGRERPTSAQQDAPMDGSAQPEARTNTYRPDSFDWSKFMQMHNVTPLPAASVPSNRSATKTKAKAKDKDKDKGKGKAKKQLVAPPPRVFDWTGTNAISDEELENAGEGSSRGVPRRSRYRNSHYNNWKLILIYVASVIANGQEHIIEAMLPIAINDQQRRWASKSKLFVCSPASASESVIWDLASQQLLRRFTTGKQYLMVVHMARGMKARRIGILDSIREPHVVKIKRLCLTELKWKR